MSRRLFNYSFWSGFFCYLILAFVWQPSPSSAVDTGACAQGVLIHSACVNACTFEQYVHKFLDQLIPYVFVIALVMIMASGIQYMNAGFSSKGAGEARTRIVGILGGVVFFFLIDLIINQIYTVKPLPAVSPAPSGPTTAAGGGIC